ncbi:MAG: hypothetical protein WCU88_12005 [Elusimicrobiota bacterium]|jgi:hypothetical protein
MSRSLGWLLLLAALALPAVFCWNWWNRTHAQKPETALSGMKAPFSSNAQAAAPAAPTAPPPAPAAAVPAGKALPPRTASAPMEQPAPAQAATPAPAAPLPEKALEPAPAIASTQPLSAAPPPTRHSGLPRIEYNPASPRDPTLSPVDYKHRAQDDLQKELNRRETLQAARGSLAREDPASVEDRIHVLGIIGNPNGKINAIIDERIVSEGDRVFGATIKRITSGTVVFEYRKRTFIKRVPK